MSNPVITPDVVSSKNGAKGTTPKYLLPAMEGVPVTEPAIYRSLYILDTIESAAAPASPTELGGAIDPFDESKMGLETQRKPAIGVLTMHRQGWVQSGLALGNLLQSLCLAPGEVTRVAVTDWRRKSTGTSTEITEQSDVVTSDIQQQRAVNAVQTGVAQELQSGGSSAVAGSVSAQAGAAISTLLATANASVATTGSTMLTAQFSAGTRDLAATSTQAISASTSEKSQALRSRRQSVVREVSQQESETLSSRIVANYNRRHSLNVEYFEVLQMYKIETEMIGWERCLFVPLEPLDFIKPEVRARHKTDLLSIFRQWGASDLATKLMNPEGDQKSIEAMKAVFDAQIKELQEADVIQKQYMEYYNVWKGLDDYFRKSIGKPMSQGNPQRDKQHVDRLKEIEQKYEAIRQKYPATLRTVAEFTATPPRVNNVQAAIEEVQIKKAAVTLTLGEVLNASRIHLSQQIWSRMDSYRIYRALQPYGIRGKPLSRLVDPHPVGVFGNYLAFRWGFGRDKEGAGERKQFEEDYLKQDPTTKVDTTTVALPTSGVFAEAVLGQGVAAEEIDEPRFGKWSDNQPPLLPPEIAAMKSRDRAKDIDWSTAGFADSLARLRAKNLEDSSLDGMLGALSKSGKMFRNMSGLSEGLALAEKVSALSAEGATAAGNRAAEMQAKILDTFVDVLNSEVGKAAVAEFMLPGAGAALLQAGGGKETPAVETRKPEKPAKPDGPAAAPVAGKPPDPGNYS
jgi:hypothetical protein